MFTHVNQVYRISAWPTAGIEAIRELISYLPQNNLEEPPLEECSDPINRLDDALNSIIPDNPNQPYDMKQVISGITDYGKFFEVHADYAQYYCEVCTLQWYFDRYRC